MKQVTIQPGVVQGVLQAPASKSFAQRAFAAALLHGGQSIIRGAGNSNDEMAALDVIQQLGSTVSKKDEGVIEVQSSGRVQPIDGAQVHFGESGLAARMFTPIVATAGRSLTLQGAGSLLQRPMDFFAAVLPPLGATVQTNNGCFPITLGGQLVPADCTIDGSLSSQFLTGLLFAFCKAKEPVTIHTQNLVSHQYIAITLAVMEAFGLAAITHQNNYAHITVQGKAAVGTINYAVEGDWSNAAFSLVAGAIAGQVTLTGLNVESVQADRAILEVLRLCGADIIIESDKISCTNKKTLQAFAFDATHCPDLFPPVAVLAAYCKGNSIIKGVDRLAHKESNRGLTLQEELGKMGIGIELNGDEMRVRGGGSVQGAVVHSRHDHRIAMACAVAALQASGATIIEEADAVNKSYPAFWSHLAALQQAN